MIDRTQLTEALAQMAVASTDTPLMGFEITIVAAAREHLAFLLDFPTNEQVEAAFRSQTGNHIVSRTMMRAALEAVGRSMIGEGE